MKRFSSLLLCLVCGGLGLAQTNPSERLVQSTVPWLDSHGACRSAVELKNLGDREVMAEVEGHKSSGALVPLTGHSAIQVRLGAGERKEFRLDPAEDMTGAWIRVRERVSSPELSPVLAVQGVTDCLIAEELHSTVREVAWPSRDPSFATEVSSGEAGVIGLINTSEQPAKVLVCYSAALFSVPTESGPSGVMMPVCSSTVQELVPPFASRQFPLARGENSRFSLTTRGEAIVLQKLTPIAPSVKSYRVESTVTFGNEAR